MSDIVERLRFLGSGEPFRGALMCEAADEIERLRDGASRWIPVTERLPETAAACWVAIEMRYEVITRLAYCERSGNWQHIDARPILSPVLAWQPIIEPEAYKP